MTPDECYNISKINKTGGLLGIICKGRAGLGAFLPPAHDLSIEGNNHEAYASNFESAWSLTRPRPGCQHNGIHRMQNKISNLRGPKTPRAFLNSHMAFQST
jgi:hypothetical protein